MRCALLLLLVATARADGVFVSTRMPVVEIPDQQAIVVWRDGRERLVIDTAHSGTGDLAWIVPLPAAPQVEAASVALFRTLEVVTMPALRDGDSGEWPTGLVLLLLVGLLSLVPARWISVGLVAVLALMLLGLGAALVVLIPKGRVESAGVSVLDRSVAGSYETATLQSVDAGALLSWLGENGFNVSPDILAGMDMYTKDGWVFTVARLKSGGSGGRAHPLSFEFESAEPVYPMRLTGKQSPPLSLRLFVLSDRRAGCDALATESCYETGASKYSRGWMRDHGDTRLIGQPDLLKIAGGAKVLTTLRGNLSGVTHDLTIKFEDYAPLVPVLHSEVAARSGAAGTATWTTLALLFPCYLAFRAVRGRRTSLVWCAAVGIGIVAGVVDYARADVVETRGDSDPFGYRDGHYHALNVVAEADTANMEEARALAAAIWRGRRNQYDAGDVREQPSPGNYGLELRDGKAAYIWYDARGTPGRR